MDDDPASFITAEDKAELERLDRLAGIESTLKLLPPVEWPPHLTTGRTIRRVALVVSPTFLGCVPGVVLNGFAWWSWLIMAAFVTAAMVWVISIEKSKRLVFERQWRDKQNRLAHLQEEVDRRIRYADEMAEKRRADAERRKAEAEAARRAQSELDRARKKDAEAKEERDKAYMLEQLRPATAAEYQTWFTGFLSQGGVPTRREPGEPKNFWIPKYRYLMVRPLHGGNALNIIVPSGCNLAFDATTDKAGDSMLYINVQGTCTTLCGSTFGIRDIVHYTGDE